MQKQDFAAMPGETLADYMNRNRPEPAPEIWGPPSFDPVHGFCWRVDGWLVSAMLDEMGSASAQWHAPEGMPAIGYTLSADGQQEALMPDAEDDDELTPGWPVSA